MFNGTFNGPVDTFSGTLSSSLTQDTRDRTALSEVESSTVFDLDATLGASYSSGSQLWRNLIASPADGESQSEYDMYLGNDETVEANDAGWVSAGAGSYFTHDGTTNFTKANDTTTTFLAKIHTTQAWWMMFCFRYAGTGFQGIAGNLASGASEGVEVLTTSTGIRVNFDRGASRTNNDITAPWGGQGVDVCGIVTYNPATDNIDYRLNGATTVTDTDASADTSAGDNTNSLYAFGGRHPNNTAWRTYSLAMGNAYLNDTQMDALRAQMALRHERSYGS